MFKLKKHLSIISIVLVSIFSSAFITFAASIPLAPSLFETSLATPISKTDLSMTLASGTLANGSSLSGYACFTVDSGTPSVEFICGTASGTSITSLTRGIDTLTGNTTTASLIFSHRRGANVKITDFPAFSVVRNIMNGQDTIPNPITYTAGVTPLNSQDLTTKAYVLSVVSGGTITTDKVIVAGTAGEAVTQGNLVYLKSDGMWWKTDADLIGTITDVQLGIAQSSALANNPITSGVLTKGIDTNNTGTAGNYAYVSNTAGAVGTSAGTYSKTIGQFRLASGGLYFNPSSYTLTSLASQGVISSTNKLVTTDNVYTADTDQTQATRDATVEVGMANTTTNKNTISQSFVPTKTKIRGVSLYKVADTGTFTGTVTVDLKADSAGSPTGSSLATVTIPNATWLTYSAGEFTATFTSEYASMVQGNTYWIVVSTSTADNSNHPNLGTNSAGGYANGSVKYYNGTDGYVAVATIDLYFKTLQGVSSQLAYISPNPVVRTYTSNGTWTKPAGLKYLEVEVQAAGGGAGLGAGAGAGGYSYKLISATSLGTTETVTVGVGGVGNNTTGNTGGSSSFGAHATATGGTNQLGGIGSSGDLNIEGSDGQIGVTDNNGSQSGTYGGLGGSSHLGGGGKGGTYGPNNGNDGNLYGGGGGGGGTQYLVGNGSGGSGANGIVKVKEYYY